MRHKPYFSEKVCKFVPLFNKWSIYIDEWKKYYINFRVVSMRYFGTLPNKTGLSCGHF